MKTTQLIWLPTPFNGHVRVVQHGRAEPVEIVNTYWDPTTETLTVGVRLPVEPEKAAWQAAQRETDAAIDRLLTPSPMMGRPPLVSGGQGRADIHEKDV